MWLHGRVLYNSMEETDDEEFRPSRASSSGVETSEDDQPRMYGSRLISQGRGLWRSSYSSTSCIVLGVALLALGLLVSFSCSATVATAAMATATPIPAAFQTADNPHAFVLRQPGVESVGRADTRRVVPNLEKLNNHRAGTGAVTWGQGGGVQKYPNATLKDAAANASERQQDSRFNETSGRNGTVTDVAARTVDGDAALRSPASGENIDVVGVLDPSVPATPVLPPVTRTKWYNAYDGARCGIGADQAVIQAAGIAFDTDAARRACNESNSSWDRVACAADVTNIVSGMSWLASILTILTEWCSVGKADLGPAVPCAADWSRATAAGTSILADVLGGSDECRPNVTIYGPDGPPVEEWEGFSDNAMFRRFRAWRRWHHAPRRPRIRRRLLRRDWPERQQHWMLRLSLTEQVAILRKKRASIRAQLQEHQDRVRRELDAREAERAARRASFQIQQDLDKGHGRRLQPLPLDVDRMLAIAVCANAVNSLGAQLSRIGVQTAAAAIGCGTTKTRIARLKCSVTILGILSRYTGATNGIFGVLASCPANPLVRAACTSDMLDLAASVITLGAFGQIFAHDCNLDNHI